VTDAEDDTGSTDRGRLDRVIDVAIELLDLF
jgi:hypothetical protein